jgi:hypothetical protein
MNKLHNFHQTRLGLLVFAVVELAITYGFASLAINDGNLVIYLLTLIFLVGFLQNFFKLIGTFFHGKRQTS